MADLREFLDRFRADVAAAVREKEANEKRRFDESGYPAAVAERMLTRPYLRHSFKLSAIVQSGGVGAIVVRDAACEYPRLPRLKNFFDGPPLLEEALVLPSAGGEAKKPLPHAADAWDRASTGLSMEDGETLSTVMDPTEEYWLEAREHVLPTVTVAYSLEMAAASDLSTAWWMTQGFAHVAFDLVTVGGVNEGKTAQLTGGAGDILKDIQADFVWIIVGPRGLEELSRESCVALLSRLVAPRGDEDPAVASKRVEQANKLSEDEARRALGVFVMPPSSRV